MEKVWVRVPKLDTYESGNEWKLGTIVGRATHDYYSTESLKSIINGPTKAMRYLIELDNGDTVEAWIWDTFEPVSSDKEDGSTSDSPTGEEE